MSNPHRRDGWHWGPFTFRLPFYHTRLLWPEFLQGLLVSTATGLALVPILVGYFGLGFEEAVTATMLYSALLVASLYAFGEPYAPGWNTAALPLVMAFVFASYPDPAQRFQAMTALSINFAVLVFVLGITGLGKKLVTWLPATLKAGIILGAAIASFILPRMNNRASRACASASRRMSNVTPVILMSICSAVTPFSVPATLKSMSPRWSSTPAMSDSTT